MREICRWVHDDCSDLHHQDKRLLNHRVSPEDDLTAAVSRYRQAAGSSIQADTGNRLDPPRGSVPLLRVAGLVKASRSAYNRSIG